jgi:AcrR family transcriptional regulator
LRQTDRPAANRHAEETRDFIVREAMELFAHYGYAKTNIGDIAQVCGMSAGNLYRYFRNKQGIGVAVVATFFAREGAMIDAKLAAAAAAGDSVEQRLRLAVVAEVMSTVEELRRAPKIVELAEMICETEEGQAVVGLHTEARQRRLAALIRAGIACGEFALADPDRAARAVQMGTRYFVVPYAVARHGLDRVEDDLALTLDLLCAGLRAGV